MNFAGIKYTSFNAHQYIIDFFTKGNKRSLDIKKNIAASFLIKGINIAISIFIVPLTLVYVNPMQYGIWLTLSSILGWINFFDVGFGNGLRNKFAEAKALGNLNLAKIYVSTTYACLTIIFITIWLLFLIVCYFIDWSVILNAPPTMAVELSRLAIIVFSFFCLQIIFKTISTVIIADQKPALSAFIDMLGQLIALISLLIFTQNSHGSILHLGIILGFSPLFILIIYTFLLYSRKYKDYAPSIDYVRFKYAKNIMSLGIKFFIIQIAIIVIYQTNNILISHIGIPTDVTIFNIALKYMGVILMGFTIIISPYWSAVTDAYTSGDYKWMKSSVKKLRVISYTIILFVIVLFFFSKYAYHLWIGNIVQVPSAVTATIGIYTVLLCWVMLNTQILNGTGKITLQLITYTIGMLLHLPVAFILGNKFGIVGVIISASLFLAIIAITSIIQVNLILDQKATGIWNK